MTTIFLNTLGDTPMQSEQDKLIEQLRGIQAPGINKLGEPRSYPALASLTPEGMEALADFVLSEKREAFERGKQVGQYQAADRIYGDVCDLYMFGDNQTSAKAKSISGWSAVNILQHTEAFMNDNSKAYSDYLATLTPKSSEEETDEQEGE